MTKEEFAQEVVSLRSMLYYVSYSLLTNSIDQDDAVQEAIHKALAKRESLREASQLKSWLTRILINECYTILRRRKREVPTEEINPVVPEGAKRELFEAIVSLEEKLRLPLVLYYYEGYKTREIARILRVPEGTVKGRLARARGQLGEMLKDEEVLA